MRESLLILFLIISSHIYSCPSFDINNDTISIGIVADFPLYQTLNNASKPEGYDIDIIESVLKNKNVKYKFVCDSKSNLALRLINKEINIIPSSKKSMLYESFAHSAAFDSISGVMVYNKKFNYKNLNSINNKKIIALKGYWGESYIKSTGISSDVITVNDLHDGVRMLMMGIGDLILCSDKLANALVSKYNIDDLNITPIKEFTPIKRYFFVSNDKIELINILNESLTEMSNSGELQSIYNKWFSKPIVSRISKEAYKIIYLLVFFVIVMLIMVVILFKNLSRKNKKIKALYSDMILAVDSGGIVLWSVNYKTKIFKCLHGDAKFDAKERNLDDLLNMVSERNRAKIFELIDDFEKLKKSKAVLALPLVFEGKRIYAEVSMRTIVEAGVFKGVIGTFKDATDRYTKEIELRDAKAKLEDFKFRIDKTITNSNIVIIEYDTINDKLKFINNAVYKDNEPVSANDIKKYVHPEDVGLFFDSLDKMKFGNVPGISFELRMKYDNEEIYQIKNISFKPFEKKDKTYTKYIGLSNIVKNPFGDYEIESFVDSMSEKTLFGQDYLANISHEIRTPLNAIVGFSDLICETDDNEDRMVFLDSIKSNSDLLLKLVSDMLELSRFESGVFDYTISEFSVNRLSKEVFDRYCNKCNNDVVMTIKSLKGDCIMSSDKKRIKQVLSNIVENAIRYTDKGSINICIDVVDEFIEFNVSDTGSGLSEENIKDVFGKYGANKNMTKGAELSLSISKFIVETLGGKIGVKSKVDEGSTFWFYIPIHPEGAVCNIDDYQYDKTNKMNENRLFESNSNKNIKILTN